MLDYKICEHFFRAFFPNFIGDLERRLRLNASIEQKSSLAPRTNLVGKNKSQRHLLALIHKSQVVSKIGRGDVSGLLRFDSSNEIDRNVLHRLACPVLKNKRKALLKQILGGQIEFAVL